MIDLHTHSTFSDGSLSPSELVAQARQAGLTALALTDHDSTAGIAEMLAACDPLSEPGPLCIPGVEISAEVAKGTMHILGYFVDHASPRLDAVLSRIREGRTMRNHRIVERLNKLGMPLSLEDVAARAGDEVVGRPHFAGAMISRGYVRSKTEAFDRYLAKGQAAYVDRFRLSPEACFQAIREAGGVSVLAHPATLDLGRAQLRTRIGLWRDAGLEGLEVYYSEHSAAMVKDLVKLAREFDLVATGGSDFHGESNPAIRLGVGFGSLAVPDHLIQPLRQRASLRPVGGGETRVR